MKQKNITNSWLNIFLILVLLLGIIFRFTNLEKKIYWIDEVHTSLRASGYSRTEFVEQAPRGKIISIEELHKFQKLTPERNFWSGITAISSSEHSPLYYVLARVGMELFGSSIAVTRGVAATLSLLLLPSVYWLALELFNAPIVALTITALVASSPLQILYAQEAREYSLFAVMIAFASAIFWKLVKSKQKKMPGIGYSLAIALGLYTHPLFLLAMMAHGVCCLLVTNFRWSKLLKQYMVSNIIGIILFIPWVLVFIFNDDGVGMWVERDLPLNLWLQRWILNLSATFFDWQAVYSERFFDVEEVQDFVGFNYGAIALLIVPLFLLISYSFYFLLCQGNRQNSLFLVTLIGVSAIALGLPDLISGGQRSTVARYILAVPLGIQIIVGYCLASKMFSARNFPWQRKLWQLITVFFITLSLVCSWQMLQAPTWWNKYSSYYNAEVAEIINQTEQPLIISNAERISRSTSLSYQLKDTARFLFLDEDDSLPSIPQSYRNVFLFRPYPEFLAKLQNNHNLYSIESVFPPGHLYKIIFSSKRTIDVN